MRISWGQIGLYLRADIHEAAYDGSHGESIHVAGSARCFLRRVEPGVYTQSQLALLLEYCAYNSGDIQRTVPAALLVVVAQSVHCSSTLLIPKSDIRTWPCSSMSVFAYNRWLSQT